MKILKESLKKYIEANLIRPWDLTPKLREEHNEEVEKKRNKQ